MVHDYGMHNREYTSPYNVHTLVGLGFLVADALGVRGQWSMTVACAILQ